MVKLNSGDGGKVIGRRAVVNSRFEISGLVSRSRWRELDAGRRAEPGSGGQDHRIPFVKVRRFLRLAGCQLTPGV